MKVLHVVGARPNFMKIAPIMHEMTKFPGDFSQLLVHTGQHYDANMSQVFFEDLDLPVPDVNLEVGSGTHAAQTAQIMAKFEPVLRDYAPDLILVPGDVNSTVACALVATKMGIGVAHVEAGLRSFDRTMPEEINRVLTDHISDVLFVSEPSGVVNLGKEGINSTKVRFVGNVMIDTLVKLLPKAEQHWEKLCSEMQLDRFTLVTLHRPSNVDDARNLSEILAALGSLAQEMAVLFPVHPRTAKRIEEMHLKVPEHVRLLPPFGYLDFLALEKHAALVVTDSGGIQEETTYLGIPCVTVRPNTERPVTVTEGTNRLSRSEHRELLKHCEEAMRQVAGRRMAPPQLWDGRAAERIVHELRMNPVHVRASDI